MASFALTGGAQFPDGTSVSVYPRTAWSAEDLAGAPSGTPAGTQTITGGSATFTGLAESTDYVAYANVAGQNRYRRFTTRTDPQPSTVGGRDVYVDDFGARGDGSTDDTTALQAAFNALAAPGDTVRLTHGKTYHHTSVIAAPAHARIRGHGRASVLEGPGVSLLAPVNTYIDADLRVSDLLLNGSSYQASGRGIDLLGASMVTLEGVKFVGYQDQLVADYCQRVRHVDCEHDALAGTRSGLWIPYGADAHAGVDPATGTTNIVESENSHFNFNANAAGFPIADDGGLQHALRNVQCSYGASSVRLGRPQGVSLEACDLEFATGATILSATTSLTGTALGAKTAQLTVGPANYFGTQVDLANVDVLVDFGNDFHIANLPVYKNCTSVTAIFSLGSGNVSTGGTMFDGNPVGNMLTYNRTGIATFRNTILGFGFRANGGGTLTNPQLWISSLPTSVNFGTNYGFGVDQNSVAITWGVADKGRAYTTAARPSAATVGAGARIYDTTLSKPVWSDGTSWRDAAGTVV